MSIRDGLVILSAAKDLHIIRGIHATGSTFPDFLIEYPWPFSWHVAAILGDTRHPFPLASSRDPVLLAPASMHMSDALISPAVGGSLWAVTAGLLAAAARRVKTSLREDLVPMMGVMGAFVFAAQMINFSIPLTGSSGHIGGGLLLAILLGPHAAFLAIVSVLTVQALFFADGGLLALGCNAFNLGVLPAFVAYPLLYRPLAGEARFGCRAWLAAIAASVVGLQLGAFAVVLETTASGISSLPLRTFAALMLPIHMAIGVVEGVATAAVVAFVARTRPAACADARPANRRVMVGFLLAALLAGGALSWFASTHPDGLEWAIGRVSGNNDVAADGSGTHRRFASVQEKTAILPDYGFRTERATEAPQSGTAPPAWPAVQAGTSVSGIMGGLMTLGLAVLVGIALKALA